MSYVGLMDKNQDIDHPIKEDFITNFVPRYRVHNLVEKKGIKGSNITEFIAQLAESISREEFKILKKECIFDGPLTLFLYRIREKSFLEKDNIKTIINSKKMLSLKNISDDALAKLRKENPPSKEDILLRRIMDKENLIIFEYDYIREFEYIDKTGLKVTKETLNTSKILFYPIYNIVAITSFDMDTADNIKNQFSSSLDTDLFVLRFFEGDFLKWKRYSSRLSSSSISLMDDENIGMERFTSKQQSDIRKSPRYISALDVGYETNIYSKKTLNSFEIGFGLNLNQGKIYFRGIIDLVQLNIIMEIASKIFKNREGIVDTNLKNGIEINIGKKDKVTIEGYKLLKLLIESPLELNKTLSDNNIDLNNFLWMMESLVDEDMLDTTENHYCPRCSSLIEEINPSESKNFCISCNWEGNYDNLIIHKIYSLNSSNRHILRDFSKNEWGIIRIIDKDIEIGLPQHIFSEVKEFDTFKIEREYLKGELREMSNKLLDVYEDDPEKKHKWGDLTGMFCYIFNKERLPHGSEEIADLICTVKLNGEDVPSAFVIKSIKDKSGSTQFRDKILSQVSRCISDTESEIIFLASTRPINQRIMTQLKALCLKSKKSFYYLDKFDLIKIFIKHKLCCEECGKPSFGKELCKECESVYKRESEIGDIKKKIKIMKWDKEKGQLPHFKLKELENLENRLNKLIK